MNYNTELLIQKLNVLATSSILEKQYKEMLAEAADTIKKQDEKITELERENIRLIKNYNELIHKKEGDCESLLCHLFEE